jgi:hypothetical protein
MARDEADPDDLMRPFPSEPMRMWPISTRVNKPEQKPRSKLPTGCATSLANASLLPNWKVMANSPGHAKYLLAGLELLQAAPLDSRDWLLEQLKKKARE